MATEDQHACNSMTYAEVSRSLAQIDNSASASHEVVAGPFSVFDPETRHVPSHPPSEHEDSDGPFWTTGIPRDFEELNGENVDCLDDEDNALEVASLDANVDQIQPFPDVSWINLPQTGWIDETAAGTVFGNQQDVLGTSDSTDSPTSAGELLLLVFWFPNSNIKSPDSQHSTWHDLAVVHPEPLYGPQDDAEDLQSSHANVDIRSTELVRSTCLPPQLDTGFFSSSNRDTTAKLLIHHYASHMVHLMQPISHQANPFERIYLPLAIRGSSDLKGRNSSGALCSPRVAVCHSLLAAAANNLQGLGSGEEDMESAAVFHRQNALITLRGALASRSSGYKDLMTAILALVSVDVSSNGTQLPGILAFTDSSRF